MLRSIGAKMAVDELADPGCRRKLITVTLRDPELLAVTRDQDCFEVFAGVGSVARAAAELGRNSATLTRPTMRHPTFALPTAFTVQCAFS